MQPMHSIHLALNRQILVVTVLVSIASTPVFSATDMVNVCHANETLHSLPDDAVKVLSLNISHGRNTALNQLFVNKKDTYRNLDRIALLLEQTAPDVVALQEADAPSRWSGNFDHVAYVAEQSGFHCFVHGLHSQRWISSYGTALLSRGRPAKSASVQFSPSWPSKQKGYLSSTFDWSAGGQRLSITLVSVHLDFLRASVRDQQVREMVAGLSDIGGPLILMGDFNSQWGDGKSPVHRLADELNLRAFDPGLGGLGTYKKSTGKRLDWILVTKDLEFTNYKVLPDVVADHFGVYAEISYRGQ
jgi:endonuclease/exonuclease/phosphatase family metal-dependent hydrolase